MEKLDGKTKDILAENILKLKELFPEVFTEGKVDGEKLKTIMGDALESSEERYSFNWKGKRDAMRLAMSQSTGTLRPAKEESKNWDTTENLYIEGDNLEVLRLLQESYRGKVKMIYIDPPYNTGHDFVYEDNFHDNVSAYKEKCGEMLKVNPDTNGRYHTNWLNMMYPRLRLAKNLLKDDGVIFISIDDNEQANLKKICDEIFGEENFIQNFMWLHGKGKKDKNSRTLEQYILCYAKKKELLSEWSILKGKNYKFENPDNDPDGPWFSGSMSFSEERSNKSHRNYFKIVSPSGVVWERQWQYSFDEVQNFINTNRVYWGGRPDYDNVPRLKIRPTDVEEVIPENIIDNVGTTKSAETDLESLMGLNIFSYPKPVGLISHIASLATDSSGNDIILDFFAGSGTTAHSVMDLNAEDAGNRKWICVQVPEGTGNDSEACKAGYPTIPEIGKERIRRAGEKIKTDYAEKLKEREKPLDVGFKVLKLDSTNFTAWDEKTGDVQKSLTGAIQSLKADRTNEDAVYEVLIKYGVDLTVPIEEITVEGKKVYSVAGNYLLVCLEDKLTLPVVEALANMKPTRVVFRDAGFADDAVKVNAEQTLKKQGVKDIRVI